MSNVMLYGKHMADGTTFKLWKARRQMYVEILRKGAKNFSS